MPDELYFELLDQLPLGLPESHEKQTAPDTSGVQQPSAGGTPPSSQDWKKEGVIVRDVESASSNRRMASSLPFNIPAQSSSKWSSPQASEEHHATSTSFVPPHKLSCRDADHLSGSVPLSSSTQIRFRTKVLQCTGSIPKNSMMGFLVSRTDQPAGDKSHVDDKRSAEDVQSPHSEEAVTGTSEFDPV